MSLRDLSPPDPVFSRGASPRRPHARALTSGVHVIVAGLLLGVLGGCRPADDAPKTKASPPKQATSGPFSSATTGSATAPAVNWVLPIFTDREGFRSMTLRGSEVRPGADNSIAVADLNITIFSGDAQAKVDSVLLSPSAKFYPKQHRATGEKSLRFIQDDVEVTGEDWTYEHDRKKVSINQNVRVTFRAQINDILK